MKKKRIETYMCVCEGCGFVYRCMFRELMGVVGCGRQGAVCECLRGIRVCLTSSKVIIDGIKASLFYEF